MVSKVLTLDILKKYLSSTLKNFDRHIQNVNILSLGQGKCLAELKVAEEHTNTFGTLHGGFSTTLVDCISTYALQSHERCSNVSGTVSVEIHMTYMKSAKIGEDILIDAKVNKVGKTLAFCEVDILNKKTKDLLVKGTHTKFLLQ